MSTEKHFNEDSDLPNVLEDPRPTDRKAAWSLPYVLLGTAVVVGLVLLLIKVL